MTVTRIKHTDIPPLSPEDVERLNALAGRPVAGDDADNPIQTADELAKAKRRGRPPKENPKDVISLRVDHDVAEWFRRRGPGYQTRMNAALRDYMEKQRAQG